MIREPKRTCLWCNFNGKLEHFPEKRDICRRCVKKRNKRIQEQWGVTDVMKWLEEPVTREYYQKKMSMVEDRTHAETTKQMFAKDDTIVCRDDGRYSDVCYLYLNRGYYCKKHQ